MLLSIGALFAIVDIIYHASHQQSDEDPDIFQSTKISNPHYITLIIASFHYTCKYGDFRYGTSWVHIQLLCLANCTFNDRSSSDTNAETDIRSVRKLQNFLQFQKTAPGSSLLFRRNLAQRTNLYSVKEPPHSSSHGRPIYAENVVDLKKPASLAEKSWLSCI